MERTRTRTKTPMTKISAKDLEKIEETPAPKVLTEVRPKLQYRKIGGGSLRLFGLIIKPNQTFSAYPEQIPPAFKDLIVCLDDAETQELAKKENVQIIVKKDEYELEQNDAGKWNVVHKTTRKKLNEKALKEVDARELLATVNP